MPSSSNRQRQDVPWSFVTHRPPDALATQSEWQEKLRDEVIAVTGGVDADGNPRPLSYDDLGKMELTEMFFKEILEIIPFTK